MGRREDQIWIFFRKVKVMEKLEPSARMGESRENGIPLSATELCLSEVHKF